jgi:hypothetical protein
MPNYVIFTDASQEKLTFQEISEAFITFQELDAKKLQTNKISTNSKHLSYLRYYTPPAD